MAVKILGVREKQPSEVLLYDVDYSEWFGASTDVPLSASVQTSRLTTTDPAPPPPSLTKVSDQVVGKVVKIVIGGGTTGEKYKVRVLLTTAAGLVKEAEFILKIKEV